MTSQLNVALIGKLYGILMCLAYFVGMTWGVFTTRHWQTSGQLVQELNVCTVTTFVVFSSLKHADATCYVTTAKSACSQISAGIGVDGSLLKEPCQMHELCVFITFLLQLQNCPNRGQ